MEPSTYIKNCLLTESRLDQEAKHDITNLLESLRLAKMSGDFADLAKRELFYKKSQTGFDLVAADVMVWGDNYYQADPEPENVKTDLSILHAAVGLISESGEIADRLLKFESSHYQALQEEDRVNLLEECGDICWYLSVMLNALGFSFEEVFAKNIAKLAKRFPDREFKQEHVLNRDLDAEYEELSTEHWIGISEALDEIIRPPDLADACLAALDRAFSNETNEPEERKTKVYLSGKMNGVPEKNYPAFNKYAADLRAQGYQVFNPAEHEDDTQPREKLMKIDLQEVLKADMVVVFGDWRDSDGACAEVLVAKETGKQVFVIDDRFLVDITDRISYDARKAISG